MRKLPVVGLALTVACVGGTVAQACGDKLMALSRGVRFQRAYAAVRPASILIYTGQNPKGKGLGADLQSVLKHAGHKLQVAVDTAQAQQLLKSGQFDLLLAELPDPNALAEEAKAASSKPTVLPVLYKPGKPELLAAEKKFGLVLRTSGVPGEILLAIEQIMKARSQTSHT